AELSVGSSQIRHLSSKQREPQLRILAAAEQHARRTLRRSERVRFAARSQRRVTQRAAGIAYAHKDLRPAPVQISVRQCRRHPSQTKSLIHLQLFSKNSHL